MRRAICRLLSVAGLSAAAFAGAGTYEKLYEEMASGVDATGAPAMPEGAKPWLDNRISRCFFGPIKRPPFNRDELMDDVDYYPDAYLAQLRDEGVNGLWLTIELRDLVETSFNRRHPTAARRLEKLRHTVEKCARYGIGVWVFAIEPMCGKASPEFYAGNKALFADDRYHLMCPSKLETQRYLKEALKDLFTQVPDLKGFINICHGERRTTCLGQFAPCPGSAPRSQLCPVCSRRQPWEVMNDILEPMLGGIREAKSDARLVCWFYMPEPCAERSEWVYDCVRHVPEGVSFQMNFESGIVCAQEGRPRVGGDYWLSQPGPSDIFRRTAEACRESGSRLAAKIQASVSHEMATVPHVPVPGLLYRKFKAMRECGVRDAMYCWYFGCSPGLMNRAAGMLSCEDFSDGEDAFLDRLAKAEWGEDASRVAGLWKTFAAAYANYPVSNMMQYYGPFHDGVAWELHPLLDLKPLSRSWKCDRADGDTVGECLEGFSLDEARRLADAMCAPLDGCLCELDALAAKYADDVRRSREIGVMKAFSILCRSGRDILAFYQARRDAVLASRVRHDGAEALRHVAEMRRLAESSRSHSVAMIPLCERDSRLGFHPEAETYKFNPEILRQRILDIDRVVCELDGIARELAAGRPYPESGLERSAPVWNAVRRKDGRVVVEGHVATGQVDSVKIDLYDETGSEYPTQMVARVEGGGFRATLPEGGDWRWIHVSGPRIPDMPAVGEPVPWRLKLDQAAVRNSARLVVAEDSSEADFISSELSKGVRISVWPEPDGGSCKGIAPYVVKNTDDGNLRLTDVARPEMALFAPQSDHPVPAVVVCPGGAYLHLSYKTEGTEIAEWLRGLGIAAFVLKYRCPNCPDKAFADAQRTISLVRSRAGEWNVDPNRIGIMGFSAGGNLAARVSTNWRHRSYATVDDADNASCRPDFTVLAYPAWLVSGSRTESTLPVVLSWEYPVDAQTPPAFLMQAQDDPVNVENVLAYYVALKYADVASELHVYPDGGHGFGIRKRGKATDGWEELSVLWLRAIVDHGAAPH